MQIGIGINIGSSRGRVRYSTDVLATANFSALGTSPLLLSGATSLTNVLTITAQFGGLYIVSNYAGYLAIPASSPLRISYDITPNAGNTALHCVLRAGAGNQIVALPAVTLGVRTQFTITPTLDGAPIVGPVALIQDRAAAGFGNITVHDIEFRW